MARQVLPAGKNRLRPSASYREPVAARGPEAEDKQVRDVAERISRSPVFSLVIIFVALLFSSPPAYAAEGEVRMCGDYQYTPLPGFISNDAAIPPGSTGVLLNMLPWVRTQKDMDTPAIYCLTEENRGRFDYRLREKTEILVRGLAKQDKRRRISSQTCDAIGHGEVYFFSYHSPIDGAVTLYDLVAVELNEPGNIYDSIFVISPGSLDRDLRTPDSAKIRDEQRRRMCGRVRELMKTIRKR